MRVENEGVEFIKGWEKYRSIAYLDQAKVWTIGYGTTKYFNGNSVKVKDRINLADATIYLFVECTGIANKLNHWLKHRCVQHEFDALVSLAYNIGTGGLRTSTLLREINRGKEIREDYFLRWHKITLDGELVPSNGLLRRRRSEWKLYSEADYTGNRS